MKYEQQPIAVEAGCKTNYLSRRSREFFMRLEILLALDRFCSRSDLQIRLKIGARTSQMDKDTSAANATHESSPFWHNSAPEWYTSGAPHVWLPYAQMQTAAAPLPVVATHGACIELADGSQLIDGIASWWTACHGYNHPHIVKAMTAQIEQMPHVMFGGLGHEPGYRLAERLARLLPGDLDHVFLADSGSVAVEIALKMALQYWINKDVAGRTKFVTFKNGYHGDTSGAMSVTDPDQGMHRVFKGHLQEQYVIGIPDSLDGLNTVDQFFAEHFESIAGMTIEPLVQGAGGMKFHDPEILAGLAALARRYDILVIADEIFTGFGRTGSMFACEEAGIVPDIMCLGKALTGGAISLAATVARGHVYEAFLSDDPEKALMHGPTYMGNPLACAAANASLDLFETEPRLEEIAAIEAQLKAGLEPCRNLTHVVDVRVKGAIGVVEVDDLTDMDWIRRNALEKGIWLRPFENIIYLTPPFTIEPQELEQLIDAVVWIVKNWNDRQ